MLLALGKAGLVRSKSLIKTRRFAVLFYRYRRSNHYSNTRHLQPGSSRSPHPSSRNWHTPYEDKRKKERYSLTWEEYIADIWIYSNCDWDAFRR